MKFQNTLQIAGQSKRVARLAHPIYEAPHSLSVWNGCRLLPAYLAHLFCHITFLWFSVMLSRKRMMWCRAYLIACEFSSACNVSSHTVNDTILFLSTQEVLGAIVYAAMAVLWERQGYGVLKFERHSK